MQKNEEEIAIEKTPSMGPSEVLHLRAPEEKKEEFTYEKALALKRELESINKKSKKCEKLDDFYAVCFHAYMQGQKLPEEFYEVNKEFCCGSPEQCLIAALKVTKCENLHKFYAVCFNAHMQGQKLPEEFYEVNKEFCCGSPEQCLIAALTVQVTFLSKNAQSFTAMWRDKKVVKARLEKLKSGLVRG